MIRAGSQIEGVKCIGAPFYAAVDSWRQAMVALIVLRRGTGGSGVGEIVLRNLVVGSPVIMVIQTASDVEIVLQVVGSHLLGPVVLIASGEALLDAVAPVATKDGPVAHVALMTRSCVVGIGKDQDGVGLRQAVHHQHAFIVLRALRAGCDVAIPTVQEAGFDGEVEHHILGAVILARAFAEC